MNHVVFIIRRTKRYWLNNKISTYRLSFNVLPIINVWNSIFNIKFMDFRNRIRDIASSTYMNNKFDEIHLYSHIDPNRIKEKNTLKNELYKNSIIVPIDEDDWIDPSLAEILRNIETDKTFFIWNCYETSNERIQKLFLKGRGGGLIKASCMWSIKGYSNFLKRHNHLKINKEEFKKIHIIDKTLSVRVSHVTAINYLNKVVYNHEKEPELWGKVLIKKIKDDINIDIGPPKIFKKQWEDYKELLKRLLKSRYQYKQII